MPARFLGVVGFVVVSLACGSALATDLICGLFSGMAKEVKRRQCWPEPFLGPDRVAARAPFASMVSNGWRRQNMLGEAHFEPSTGKLTEAGRMKVRWILLSGPQQHRAVFVHAAINDEETGARMVAVQQLVAQIAPTNMAPVMATTIADDGWSAAEVDAINRKYMGSTPVPRLAPPAGASGGGGSGGMGGGT
jgi:hypothetical protein